MKEKPMSEDDEIILSELGDDELVQQMFDDLYDGLKAVSYTHLTLPTTSRV